MDYEGIRLKMSKKFWEKKMEKNRLLKNSSIIKAGKVSRSVVKDVKSAQSPYLLNTKRKLENLKI